MASLDPLDRELFQRAFDAACSAVKADELDSDEKLEAALRCELLSIAVLNGMSDPERFINLVLARFSEGDQAEVSIGTSSQIAFRALKLGGAAQSTKPLTPTSDTRWIAAESASSRRFSLLRLWQSISPRARDRGHIGAEYPCISPPVRRMSCHSPLRSGLPRYQA